MLIKDLVDEVFQDYKYPSMYIAMPYCNMKCGKNVCQNSAVVFQKNIDISYQSIRERYDNNPITKAIIFSGLEPFDSFDDLYGFVKYFRNTNPDDIVIYSGYKKCEINYKVSLLSVYKNIIVKYGRYATNQSPHYDNILGVNLASNNQYAERI